MRRLRAEGEFEFIIAMAIIFFFLMPKFAPNEYNKGVSFIKSSVEQIGYVTTNETPEKHGYRENVEKF